MCNFSGKLVAWMDRELSDNEAVDVERHVRDCSECRGRVGAYREVSRLFVTYCDAAAKGATTRRKLPRWVPVLSSAVAVAVLLLIFRPASIKQIPVPARVADASPSMVPETAPRPVKKAHRRQVTPVKTPQATWAFAEPFIQIAIPAEAMFAPGAVPEGLTYIADLSMASDGSIQRLRLQQ
jgi:hypothetical protein